jgi:hypothetical protein
MRVAFLRVFVLVFVVVAGGVLAAQEQKPNAAGEQTLFYEEKPLQQQVALSPEVLKVLMETKQATQGSDFASDAQRANPAQLFRAAAVHLISKDEVDLVVIGVPPMSGADTGWFWVVRSARKDPEVVLFADGNSLEVMDTKTNGSRDIRSIWSSPSQTNYTIYHFDGGTYKVWKNKWTENRR